jgi:hypothetical protein
VFGVTNLTTDASGRANLTLNMSLFESAFDDLFNGGLNLTFRAVLGNDSASSDGKWWGEDEEHGLPDPFISLIQDLFDTNLEFRTEPVAVGADFGAGVKYTGSKDVSTFEGAAVLMPAPVTQIFDGLTQEYDVWTGHDIPFVNVLVDGDGQEYYGTLRVPQY